MQTKNILADLGTMTSVELLALIDERELPRALQIAPPGFNRLESHRFSAEPTQSPRSAVPRDRVEVITGSQVFV